MITRGVVRTVAGGAALALFVVASNPAHAQGVLGRVRDRARQAVTGNQAPAAPVRCDASQRVTADFVTRYIRALQARETELRRLAGENSRAGRYFAAMLAQDSQQRRKNDFGAQIGPDWARRTVLYNRMMTGDQAAAQQLSALAQEIDRQVNLPNDEDFSAVTAATARMDTVMMQGGGFSRCDWLAVGEAIPSGVAQIARDPSAPIASMGTGGLTEDGIAAVRAHRLELVRLLKLDYKSDEMIAREQRERAQRDSMTNAMNAWTACRQRVMGPSGAPSAAGSGVNPDSMRVWQRQIEDAQKRGDQNTAMAVGMKLGAAMMTPNMQAQAMGAARAQQECGPVPGSTVPKRE